MWIFKLRHSLFLENLLLFPIIYLLWDIPDFAAFIFIYWDPTLPQFCVITNPRGATQFPDLIYFNTCFFLYLSLLNSWFYLFLIFRIFYIDVSQNLEFPTYFVFSEGRIWHRWFKTQVSDAHIRMYNKIWGEIHPAECVITPLPFSTGWDIGIMFIQLPK